MNPEGQNPSLAPFPAGQPMTAGEFLQLYTLGAPVALSTPQGCSRPFLLIVWNGGLNRKLIHVHDLQAASEIWLETQIKKRLCRTN